MGKLVGWVLSFTKLGKVVEPVQSFLSGKKSYLSGIAIALPAIITIVTRFSDLGMPYLFNVTHTSEWALMLNGLAIMGLRAAISKAADATKDPNGPAA